MNITQRLVDAHGSRGVHKPLLIVLHIIVGTAGSAYNTFKNTSNKKSSTYITSRNGEIWQCVPLSRAPWTNGTIRNPMSTVVRGIGAAVNPNMYSVTIENEGWEGNGVDGDITEEQFWSLVWLIKKIQLDVLKAYGNRIPLNSERVLGHNQIDSIGKAHCPGVRFPFARLYSELAVIDTMDDLAHVEERISAQQDNKSARAYAIVTRINQLSSRLKDPKWGASASDKLGWLMELLPDASTPEDVVKAVLGYYNEKNYDAVIYFEPLMKEKGLL